jgi:hypothetical protein
MDELFGEAPGPVPQGDDDESEHGDEENQLAQERERPSVEERRPLRRSISSHPRFMSEEERVARQAAAKVAEEERRKSQGPPRGFFGSWRSQSAMNANEYTPIRNNEH